MGYKIGDQLGSIVVKDCDGNDVSLDRFCGASALWIFAAWAWCPHCQAVTTKQESIMSGYVGKNVAAVNILVETTSFSPPTAADCKTWRDTYKLGTNVVPLYDPSGKVVDALLNDSNVTALSVFVATDRVITGKSHSDVTSALTSGIDQALAHQ